MSSVPRENEAPKETTDAFQNFIEERYGEWEREFGDEVDARRTTFDSKK